MMKFFRDVSARRERGNRKERSLSPWHMQDDRMTDYCILGGRPVRIIAYLCLRVNTMGKERRIITLILSCLFILCHVATAFSSFPQTSFRATFLRTTSSALRHLVIKRQSSSSTPEGSSTSRRRSRDPSTRRPDRPRPARRRNPPSSSTRAARRTAAPIKRAPHQFDHTKEDSRPFVDAATEIERQSPNEDAPTYDLDASRDLRCISLSQESEQKEEQEEDGRIISHPHIEFYSLDDLFPCLDFSHRFSTSQAFREELRNSIREDIFDSTASYSSLPEKARRVLLLPDSSLQGTWKCSSSSGGGGEKEGIRMKKLTNVLAEHLDLMLQMVMFS